MKNLEKLAISGVLRTPRVLLLLAFTAGLSQAAISNCAVSGSVPFVTSPTSPVATDGCSSVDLNFVSFSKSGSTAAGLTGLTYSGTAGTINTVPVPDTITTTTLNIASSQDLTGLAGPKQSSATYSLSYQTNNNGTNAVTDANYVWAFSGIFFRPTMTLNGGDLTTITYTFCFNATAGTAGSGGCVATNQGSVTVDYTRSGTQVVGSVTSSSYGSAITGPGNGSAPTIIDLTTTSLQLTLSPNSQFSSMFLSANIVMTANTGQNSYLTNFAVGYDQTAASTIPEPGTMGMLGAGLLGFGLLAGRKRS